MAIHRKTNTEPFFEPGNPETSQVAPAETSQEEVDPDRLLYVQRPDGTIDMGWVAEKSYFDEDGVEKVVVAKGDKQAIIPLAELDSLQQEMRDHLANSRLSVGDAALHHIGIEEPNPGSERVTVRVIHGAQKEK